MWKQLRNHANFYFSTVVFCLPLDNIENGHVTYTTSRHKEGYVVDTLAELSCDCGYRTSTFPAESRQCERSGDWNGQTQSCMEGNECNTSFGLV